jgi:lipopolysaccharide export system permease protein
MRLSAPRIHPLDRYVSAEFWKIFFTTATGFPLLVILIDLTDKAKDFLGRNLSPRAIIIGYLYAIPGSVFLVLPAAVLFATIFCIGALTRHSEITAAKASGISFYRVTAPIYVAACIAAVLGLGLGAVVPATNAKHDELLQEQRYRGGNERYNFAFSARDGRVYQIGSVNAARGTIAQLEIVRKGTGPAYPTYVLSAALGRWTPHHGWGLHRGMLHVFPDSVSDFAVQFDSAHDNRLREIPTDLMSIPRNPDDLGYGDLRRFIAALQRSGGNADELRVELAQKIAVPITCIIIALFGAPLATTTQRGGAAYGIAVSLGTTVIFLMMIQLSKAIGAKGIIEPPELAAWVPNLLFALAGGVLLARVRT